MDEKEIWLPVVGYECLYEVNNLGNVRSLDYLQTGRVQLLKPVMTNRGYLKVCLCKDGKHKYYGVHRLVAQAFLTNAENLPQVNHRDENKQNNCVSNLEWCTAKYNMNYGTAISRRAAANTNGKCSKTVQQLTKDGVLVATWPSIREAERVTGVNNRHICGCCNSERHTAGGYKWQYA